VTSAGVHEPPDEVAITDSAIATLRVDGYPDFLASDGRAVWVTNEDRVEKLQADRPGPVGTVRVAGPCGAMVVADGSLWVASCKDLSVYRLDLGSGDVVANIPTGLADATGELSLAAGAGSVWVLTSAGGILSRIDCVSNEVVAEIRVLPHSYAAAFAFEAVWITNSGTPDDSSPGSVQRIDPETNQVVATIPVGPIPRFLAAGEGAVWTLNWGDGSVTRIDPRTNQPVVTIPLGMEGGGGDIATGGGKVWIRGTKVLLAAVDPTTNRVATIYGPPAGSGAVRVAGDLVWVTAHDTNTVWVLRPASAPEGHLDIE
jgi:virginiamycin B lyase